VHRIHLAQNRGTVMNLRVAKHVINFVTSWWVMFHGLRFYASVPALSFQGPSDPIKWTVLWDCVSHSASSSVYHFVVLLHSWRQFHVHFLLMTWYDRVPSSACDILEFRERHCWTVYSYCVLQYTRSSTDYPCSAQWRGKQELQQSQETFNKLCA